MKEFTPMPLADEALKELKAQRASNREVVEKYLSIEGAANYEQRLALLAEDVMYEQVFTMDTLPDRICGISRVRERYEKTAKLWEDFCYRNVEIRETQYPDTFLVECDMYGTMVSPMLVEPERVREYHNYGFIQFVVREGKIWQLRLFDNPMKLLHDFWSWMPNYVC